MGELIEKYEDPVETPRDGYERLGIRSHAKGTFHSYVEPGKELDTAKMHRVAANKFIVNITFGWEHAVAITDESDAGKLVSHRFPQFSFGNNRLTPFFFKYVMLDKKFREHLELSSPGGAGRNRVLKLNEMMDYVVTYPSLDEQDKISKYFLELDHLITLHQRNEIMILHKYSVQIAEKSCGFTYVWEQRKFKDTFDFMQNNALSRAELSSADGEIMNVHYGDILVKYGEVLDVKKDELTYLLDASLVKKYQTSLLQNGDIIIADAAEDETVGKCSEMAGLTDEIVLSGLHTIPCRPKGNFSEGYLGYYMNSGSYHDQLLPLIQGTKISSISKSAIQDTEIMYPKSESEQEQIGAYFKNLDHLITLHQRKYAYRFNNFMYYRVIYAWEQRKVTEVGKIFIGLVTTMTKHYTTEGNLLIRNSDIKDGYFDFGENPIYLEKSFAEENNTRMHQVGDVITVHTGDVGTSAVISENEVNSIGFATIVTRPNPKIIDSDYLATFLNTEQHKRWAVSISTGDGRTNYNLGDYYELVVPVPNIEEQKKIAEYIKNLNHLITLHQRKLFARKWRKFYVKRSKKYGLLL